MTGFNPGGKSFANRQRFAARARKCARGAEASSTRSIKDVGKGGRVPDPRGRRYELHLRRAGEGGVRAIIFCPATRNTWKATPSRAPEQGGGKGSRATDSGEGEDEFWLRAVG